MRNLRLKSFWKPGLKNEKDELSKSKEKIKESRSRLKWSVGKLNGIYAKLFLMVLIPVVCMAAFGIVSYRKSSEAIIKDYQKSTTDTIKAVSDYLSLGIDSVEGKSLELIQAESVRNYYDRAKVGAASSVEEIKLSQPLGENIMITQGSNDFIQGVHIFGKVGNGVSTESAPPADIYAGFKESAEGKAILSSKDNYIWIGEHPFIDEMFSIKKDDYAMSVIRKMVFENGYVIMDVSMEEIKNMLSQFDYGKESIFGFVTADGREILSNTDKTKVFTGLDYYKKSESGKDEKGNSYENYQGKEYIYLYDKVGNTGAMVCALIPKSTITKQAQSIRTLNLVFVLIAGILTIFIGILLAGGIAAAINKLMKTITKAAKGDLTVTFTTKRKDEFQILSDGLTYMVAGMKNLIGHVAEVGTRVIGSADLLSSTSESILKDTRGISFTIDEIEKGIVQQASDTELCLGQMSNLAERINHVYENTYKIEDIANHTKAIIGNGIVIIDELNDKSKATTEITEVVISEIGALAVQSHSIENFVDVINEIAVQTNLLSVNASIEAAHAGEAGRGFAVVAGEIRKLADQSVNAVKEIQSIVHEIQNKTMRAEVSAKQAETIVQSQEEALNRTVNAFEEINHCVNNLATSLNNISVGVKDIDTAKTDTLEAIRSIAAISQQTAAASEEVSATANNQIESVENLRESAAELAVYAKKLEESIQAFRISKG